MPVYLVCSVLFAKTIHQQCSCWFLHRIANALEVAADFGFEGQTNAFVESIGCVDLSRTVSYKAGKGSMLDGGLTDCQGCLDGSTFIGE